MVIRGVNATRFRFSRDEDGIWTTPMMRNDKESN